MNVKLLVDILGGLVILMAIWEIFTGSAWEKFGMVKIAERPVRFWISVTIKIVVGMAMLNVDYLQSIGVLGK